MFLASIFFEGRDRIALRMTDGDLIDLTDAITALGGDWTGGAVPEDMLTLVQRGHELMPALRDLSKCVDELGLRTFPQEAVEWHPPIRRPGKIVGVAMNNSASDDRKISAPDHPMFFLKAGTSLLGHRRDIEVRSYYGGLHPEPELAVVIGARARDLDPASALEAVFGYSIMNDLTGNVMRSEDMVHYYALYASADDPTRLERREQHLSYAARYKGTDGFGPMGPWLATRDEIADPGQLEVRCRVAGEIVAEDSTRYLTYPVAEILAYLSRFQTLEPGDVISMGTAFRPRPGVARSIHTADLQRFDGPVEVTISGLGTLSNTLRRVESELAGWRLDR